MYGIHRDRVVGVGDVELGLSSSIQALRRSGWNAFGQGQLHILVLVSFAGVMKTYLVNKNENKIILKTE